MGVEWEPHPLAPSPEGKGGMRIVGVGVVVVVGVCVGFVWGLCGSWVGGRGVFFGGFF